MLGLDNSEHLGSGQAVLVYLYIETLSKFEETRRVLSFSFDGVTGYVTFQSPVSRVGLTRKELRITLGI